MTDRPLVVDSHQHFWDTNRFDYFWMQGADSAPLRRPIGPADLAPLLRAAGVDATVTVQALQSVDETRWLLEIAAATPFVAGVVGWVDMTDSHVDATLAELQSRPDGRFLVGIRHMAQDEPDPNWLLRSDVEPGLRAVADAGLAYDLLLRPPQIAAAARLCAELPDVRFVVDHLAKPEIAHDEFDRWSELMAPFGAMPHVWCKLSGMVSEADWTVQTAEDLKPYVDRAMELFGEDRVMFGSDWPVSTLACPYGEVERALDMALGPIPAETRAKIFGGNAARFYGLHLEAEGIGREA
jgi:L-fuconolactonase